jgi:hypothetical protein
MNRYLIIKNIFKITTRSIYSDKFLYIDKFRKEKMLVEKNLKQKDIG